MITLLTTVMYGAREPLELPLLGRVREVKGFLTSGDVAAKSSPSFSPTVSALPVISDGNKVGEREEERERNNKTCLSPAGLKRGLLSCLLGGRENTGVILEITLLKINVGLEECVIAP